ncbi:hypothetical protein BJX61DRAFT_485785 [Aspergillus egyptiacus]|nr:hypothetical protein BJX61DRAFT_485785 [Aspergillus egyptiacus]
MDPEPIQAPPLTTPEWPADTVIEVNDSTLFVVFSRMAEHVPRLQGIKPNSVHYPWSGISYDLIATKDEYHGGFMLIPKSPYLPQPTCAQVGRQGLQFIQWLRAVHGHVQKFTTLREVHKFYRFAVKIGRYDWLGDYLHTTLLLDVNGHLWNELRERHLKTLVMAENLRIRWLYRDAFIYLCRAHIRKSNYQQAQLWRDIMKAGVSNQSRVAFRLFSSDRYRMRKAKDNGIGLLRCIQHRFRREEDQHKREPLGRFSEALSAKYQTEFPGRNDPLALTDRLWLENVLAAL